MFQRRAKTPREILDPRLGLDTISFDTFGWPLESDDGEARVWVGVGVDIVLSEHFFALPPNLPSLRTEDLRNFYESLLAGAGGTGEDIRTARIVEVDIDLSVPVLRTLIRLPQPDRYAFIGALTVPLAACSWVVKLAAMEGSITGVRESIAVVKTLRERTGQSLEAIMADLDPYDRRWDYNVPWDPLSAVRDHLDRLQASLQRRLEYYDQVPFQR